METNYIRLYWLTCRALGFFDLPESTLRAARVILDYSLWLGRGVARFEGRALFLSETGMTKGHISAGLADLERKGMVKRWGSDHDVTFYEFVCDWTKWRVALRRIEWSDDGKLRALVEGMDPLQQRCRSLTLAENEPAPVADGETAKTLGRPAEPDAGREVTRSGTLSGPVLVKRVSNTLVTGTGTSTEWPGPVVPEPGTSSRQDLLDEAERCLGSDFVATHGGLLVHLSRANDGYSATQCYNAVWRAIGALKERRQDIRRERLKGDGVQWFKSAYRRTRADAAKRTAAKAQAD